VRDYETIVLLKPDTADAAVKALAKKVEKVLEGKPGKVAKKDDWGVKRLAYPIKKEKKARYLFWSYAQAPNVLGQLDRAIRFDENILRYMTVTVGEHGKTKKKDVEKAKKMEKAAKWQQERMDEEEGEERRSSTPVRIDYKDPMTLVPFITERGKIVPQRQSRFTATEQRFLAQAIKRSRHLALLSYVSGYAGGGRDNAPHSPAPQQDTGGHAS
jgi:small subunit ribosomal protein S6